MEKELESLRKEIIERIDKILAKEKAPLEIVPGKWYLGLSGGREDGDPFLIHATELREDRVWGDIHWTSWGRNNSHLTRGNDWATLAYIKRPATKEEIEAALLPYIKETYKPGTKFISAAPDCSDWEGVIPNNPGFASTERGSYYVIGSIGPGNTLFSADTGKFAEKVTEPEYDCKGLEVRHDGTAVFLNGFVWASRELHRMRDLLKSGLSVNDLNKIIEGK